MQDASGNLTTADYDSLGHMVKLVSKDAGQTEWRYDTAGRLGAKETANLRASTQLIKFGYELNRLKTITYPKTPQVTYTYGDADHAGTANGNVAGRIAQIKDESGVENHKYDALGNVSHMDKAPQTQLPSIPTVTYNMEYAYDSLGRALSITYPDGEQVTYGYDAGGMVHDVSGTRNGTTTTYVSSVGYNELGQRVTMVLGNGVVSQYQYYPDTKRLLGLATTSPKVHTDLQSLSYTYDLVGNVTGLKNFLSVPTPVPPNTVIAPGPNTQSFTYDDLYQLTSASGFYQGCACGCANDRQYTLTMQYDGLGNITRKTQNDVIEAPAGSGPAHDPSWRARYNNPYTYAPARPHAPSAIGPQSMTYDADGNMLTSTGTFGPSRTLTWTEDDRLRSEIDSGFTSTYLYDADGTRSHKRRNTLETWYVNPLYVVKNSLTETKHIMMGETVWSRRSRRSATAPIRRPRARPRCSTTTRITFRAHTSPRAPTAAPCSTTSTSRAARSGSRSRRTTTAATRSLAVQRQGAGRDRPLLLRGSLLQPEVLDVAEPGSDPRQLHAWRGERRRLCSAEPGAVHVRLEQPRRTPGSEWCSTDGGANRSIPTRDAGRRPRDRRRPTDDRQCG